jgi:hypothetical protein
MAVTPAGRLEGSDDISAEGIMRAGTTRMDWRSTDVED